MPDPKSIEDVSRSDPKPTVEDVSRSDPIPTLEEVRRWSPEQLNAYLQPRIPAYIRAALWDSFANLSPPIDGATFIDRGGDCDYWMLKRGLKAGISLYLQKLVDKLGGPVVFTPPPSSPTWKRRRELPKPPPPTMPRMWSQS
jgi:hypothetical protein